MISLNLPSYPFKTSYVDGKKMIFDVFRKTYVVLTPEEWVRQHFLLWLVNDLVYPAGRIAVETTLSYNNLKKRADAVVYSKPGQPIMIIECKAPNVSVTDNTLHQAARYNASLNTSYMVLTNGLQHYCCFIDLQANNVRFLETIPAYHDLHK